MAARRTFIYVFEVQEDEPIAVFLHDGKGIAARIVRPADVELQFDRRYAFQIEIEKGLSVCLGQAFVLVVVKDE